MTKEAFLISWDGKEAKQAAALIEAAGWHIAGSETKDGGRACQQITAILPDAVVIYLTRKPSHGYETAKALQESSTTAELPIIFVGGQGKMTAQMKLDMPDAIFSYKESLSPKLKRMAAK